MEAAILITAVVMVDADAEMIIMVPVALGGTNEAAAGLTTTTDRILDRIQVRLHRLEVQVSESVCHLPLPQQATTITTNPMVTRLELLEAITKVGASPRPNTLHEDHIKGTMAATSTTITTTGVEADTEARGRGNASEHGWGSNDAARIER